jgi:FixJ family two-component response regulator
VHRGYNADPADILLGHLAVGCDEVTSTHLAIGRLRGPAKLMGDTVYVIDATPAERRRIADALAREPVTVEAYDSAEDFLDQVTAIRSGCVLVPSDLSGMGVRALISEISRRHVPLAIVVIGHKPDLAIAVELVRAGAADFLEQPFSDRQLRSVVRNAIGHNG